MDSEVGTVANYQLGEVDNYCVEGKSNSVNNMQKSISKIDEF